jgi:hypothetical protein
VIAAARNHTHRMEQCHAGWDRTQKWRRQVRVSEGSVTDGVLDHPWRRRKHRACASADVEFRTPRAGQSSRDLRGASGERPIIAVLPERQSIEPEHSASIKRNARLARHSGDRSRLALNVNRATLPITSACNPRRRPTRGGGWVVYFGYAYRLPAVSLRSRCGQIAPTRKPWFCVLKANP